MSAPEQITYNAVYQVTYEGADPTRGHVYVRADRAEAALREARDALHRIAMEAERTNGSWVHLKRSIAINARAALEPKP